MALASVRGLLINGVPKILTNKASAQQIRYTDIATTRNGLIPSTHIPQYVIISNYRGIL